MNAWTALVVVAAMPLSLACDSVGSIGSQDSALHNRHDAGASSDAGQTRPDAGWDAGAVLPDGGCTSTADCPSGTVCNVAYYGSFWPLAGDPQLNGTAENACVADCRVQTAACANSGTAGLVCDTGSGLCRGAYTGPSGGHFTAQSWTPGAYCTVDAGSDLSPVCDNMYCVTAAGTLGGNCFQLDSYSLIVQTCNTAADCPEGEGCFASGQFNVCSPDCRAHPDYCGNTAACDALSGACLPGGIGAHCATGGPSCVSPLFCSMELGADGGTCTETCSTTCPGTAVCQTATQLCVQPCKADTDCSQTGYNEPFPYYCSLSAGRPSGTCVPNPTVFPDVCSASTANNGTCTSGIPVVPGDAGVGGYCEPSPGAGPFCADRTNNCVVNEGASGGVCEGNPFAEACAAGTIGVNFSCVAPCATTANCPAGEVCTTAEPTGSNYCVPDCRVYTGFCGTQFSCGAPTGLCQ